MFSVINNPVKGCHALNLTAKPYNRHNFGSLGRLEILGDTKIRIAG